METVGRASDEESDVEVIPVDENDSELTSEAVAESSEFTKFTSEAPERATRLPLSRIKAIMKLDKDVSLASQDTVFLICKATEMFIENFSKEAATFTNQGKRKTVQKKDLETAIEHSDEYAFLEGCLEETRT